MKDRYEIEHAELATRLWHLGWIAATSREQARQAAVDDVLNSLRSYQAFHGLEADGWAGPVTERSLSQPRFCGLPDRMEQQAEVCRWPMREVSWAITGRLPGVPAAAQKDAYQLAWSYWTSVCGIAPTYVANARTANILMGAGRIDREGGTLAWSELPCTAGTNSQLKQLFDTREPWVISATPGPQQIDLVRVAAHEIGHVIGIPHLSSGNLLAPTYDPQIRRPQAGDIAEARRRYGEPKSDSGDNDHKTGELTIHVQGAIEQVAIPGYRITPIG